MEGDEGVAFAAAMPQAFFPIPVGCEFWSPSLELLQRGCAFQGL